ncbi:MAG: type II toxin-antitoxin system HicA family toxin [Candidatus Omnitrophica bacterium]|nr:type II toxin-antitoxin system HicA family toxin [Candidatus Omnitrophota bacterium]
MDGKQLIKILQEYGWELDRIKGSHHILTKKGKRSIPVPVHGNKDLPHGLINAIVKQAGIKNGDW